MEMIGRVLFSEYGWPLIAVCCFGVYLVIEYWPKLKSYVRPDDWQNVVAPQDLAKRLDDLEHEGVHTLLPAVIGQPPWAHPEIFERTAGLWKRNLLRALREAGATDNAISRLEAMPITLDKKVVEEGLDWINRVRRQSGADPIRASIKILTPRTWAGQIIFPVQVVNREQRPLALSAEYELVTDRGTYTAYVVSLDGRPPHGARAANPNVPMNTTAVITQFMPTPVPERWKDRVKYPSQDERQLEHRLVFTDVNTNRKAVVSDRQDYDAS